MISLGSAIHFFGYIHQPGFGLVCPSSVPAPSIMVVQVLCIGIPLGHAVFLVGQINVPAHKINGVTEISSFGILVTGLILVFTPGAIQCL